MGKEVLSIDEYLNIVKWMESGEGWAQIRRSDFCKRAKRLADEVFNYCAAFNDGKVAIADGLADEPRWLAAWGKQGVESIWGTVKLRYNEDYTGVDATFYASIQNAQGKVARTYVYRLKNGAWEYICRVGVEEGNEERFFEKKVLETLNWVGEVL